MADRKPMHLTDKSVRDLPLVPSGAKPAQYEVRDTELPNFFVRVSAKSKMYYVNVEVKGATRRASKRVIGDALELNATKARKEAQRKIVALQKELESPIVTDDGPTLWQAYEDYKVHLAHEKAAQDTFDDYANTVEFHLKDWHDVLLLTLANNPKMMRDRHAEITKKRGPIIANHVARNLRAIYNHARRAYSKILPFDHPSTAVTFNDERPSKRAMVVEALPDWYTRVQKITNPIQREFQILTLLTGSRPGVLSRIPPKHVNRDEKALFLQKPKGGEDRAFWVPMSDPIMECIDRLLVFGPALHQELAKRWIFPAKSKSGHLTAWRKRNGLKTGKALRQTFRTMAKKAGVDKFYVQLLMNHRLTREGDEVGQGEDVSEDYINVFGLTPELCAAQEKISSFIMDALLKEKP